MNLNTAADWALMRACGPFRKDGVCDHKACSEAKEIHDWLKSALRVDEEASNGDKIRGWLIPDQADSKVPPGYYG